MYEPSSSFCYATGSDLPKKASSAVYVTQSEPVEASEITDVRPVGVIYVALGGATGAVARYLVTNWMTSWFGPDFPWGTFFANVSGSFLIGIVLILVEGGSLPEGARLLLAVGILGGYTTFSSFSHESLQLMSNGAILGALFNMFGQLALGLVFVYLGMTLGRLIWGA